MPPFISAVVTVPKFAIVVLAKVEFLLTTICSLPFEVINFIYELPPSVIFKASARLSVRVILFKVVLPPNVIFKPTEAPSTTILSQAIEPALVMFPSLTSKEVTVVAPAPSVPDVVRFSFPKLIAPLVSIILPFDNVRLPIVVPVLNLEVSSVAITFPTHKSDKL